MSLKDKRTEFNTEILYYEEDVAEAVKEIEAWALKWGYKGVSPECWKELKEITGEFEE